MGFAYLVSADTCTYDLDAMVSKSFRNADMGMSWVEFSRKKNKKIRTELYSVTQNQWKFMATRNAKAQRIKHKMETATQEKREKNTNEKK